MCSNFTSFSFVTEELVRIRVIYEGLVRFFSGVKNWYSIFTNVKNRYQFFIPVKNWYRSCDVIIVGVSWAFTQQGVL